MNLLPVMDIVLYLLVWIYVLVLLVMVLSSKLLRRMKLFLILDMLLIGVIGIWSCFWMTLIMLLYVIVIHIVLSRSWVHRR